jgi:hypothetical protein
MDREARHRKRRPSGRGRSWRPRGRRRRRRRRRAEQHGLWANSVHRTLVFSEFPPILGIWIVDSRIRSCMSGSYHHYRCWFSSVRVSLQFGLERFMRDFRFRAPSASCTSPHTRAKWWQCGALGSLSVYHRSIISLSSVAARWQLGASGPSLEGWPTLCTPGLRGARAKAWGLLIRAEAYLPLSLSPVLSLLVFRSLRWGFTGGCPRPPQRRRQRRRQWRRQWQRRQWRQRTRPSSPSSPSSRRCAPQLAQASPQPP